MVDGIACEKYDSNLVVSALTEVDLDDDEDDDEPDDEGLIDDEAAVSDDDGEMDREVRRVQRNNDPADDTF